MDIGLARVNLEASVKEAGFDWIVEVEHGDDYTVRLRKGSRKFLKKNISRGVLEDESSRDGMARGPLRLVSDGMVARPVVSIVVDIKAILGRGQRGRGRRSCRERARVSHHLLTP